MLRQTKTNIHWSHNVTSPKFAPTLTELMPVDGRFLTATFNTAQAPLKFIATYAPHNEIDYDIRQKYHDQLAKLVSDTPNSTNLILLGDLNAQIHEQTLANQNITGPHGQQPTHTQIQQDGEEPNNAELIHQFCEAQTMCFPQTWMQKKNRATTHTQKTTGLHSPTRPPLNKTTMEKQRTQHHNQARHLTQLQPVPGQSNNTHQKSSTTGKTQIKHNQHASIKGGQTTIKQMRSIHSQH